MCVVCSLTAQSALNFTIKSSYTGMSCFVRRRETTIDLYRIIYITIVIGFFWAVSCKINQYCGINIVYFLYLP